MELAIVRSEGIRPFSAAAAPSSCIIIAGASDSSIRTAEFIRRIRPPPTRSDWAIIILRSLAARCA